MANFTELPNGLKVLDTTPTGNGGNVLDDNFALIDNTIGQVASLIASAGGTYTFTQSVAATTWTIHHNLGRFPTITVVDSSGTVCVGDSQYVDDNTIVLTFGGAFSGKAYLR